ncbi:MAG: metallopeptidase TldD-related protein [Candidatus Eremiobacteraeota bacterium]|nr:metallopeptidase TldD-related protein [Candidatus Eremiobacteraeota bacterium]
MLTALDPVLLARVLARALRRGGDFADVFFENRLTQTFRLQDARIHDASSTVIRGAGVRVVVGQRAGYAYSEDLDEAALLRAADAASLIARDGREQDVVVELTAASAPVLYDAHADEPADSARYVDLLARADGAARAFDSRVASVNAFVTDELQYVQIASSDGRVVTDRRPLVALGVQVVAREGAQRENGYIGDGGRTSIDVFAQTTPESLGRESARIATTKLGARDAPAGELPVVIGAGGGGVLLHEAVGHGLEADFNRKGTSLYAGRVGERVASDLVTIFDDGDLPGERGSVAVDDEGTPGRHKVLVEDGILRGYMQDRLNARLMGVASTGSGRRESYRVLPQPRMCNTFMPAGTSTPEEIIGSIERGLYATSFSGGQVEISKGDFVFMIAEGYLIEDGKIAAPVRGATLVGNGPDAMTKVTMVGHDARLANRSYTCGKGGQRVPVGVGIPTVKLSSCTVGGTGRG